MEYRLQQLNLAVSQSHDDYDRAIDRPHDDCDGRNARRIYRHRSGSRRFGQLQPRGTSLGNCALSSGTCSINVSGTALQLGSNSITATFTSTGAYPTSTSSAAMVTVTSTQPSGTITFGALPGVTYGVSPITLHATASSGLPVSYTVTGPATVSGSTLTITGAGQVTVTASQAGNSSYAAATPVQQSFTVAKALLTAKAASLTRAYGAANPTFTYALSGFVNADNSSVVLGAATLTTTANPTSPPGTYSISFASQMLTAKNYTFAYVSGTLTDTGGPWFTITASPAVETIHRGILGVFLLTLNR